VIEAPTAPTRAAPIPSITTVLDRRERTCEDSQEICFHGGSVWIRRKFLTGPRPLHRSAPALMICSLRVESRTQARKYLRGLLAGLERKTTWQLAEVVKDGTPDRMQRLLYRVPWDAEAARDRLQQFVIERFGDQEGIAVLDETGIPKKGTRSVGVHKQYCGALGKIEHCQVATRLSYATARGHVFLDRRLFLPEDWCFDRARRAKAKVPEAVTFQTKPEQARAMLEQAWKQGVPMRLSSRAIQSMVILLICGQRSRPMAVGMCWP
jgi:hypothetical protein